MSKRARFWIISFVGFIICSALIVLTAYSVGADPFHPRSRHIWALSLVAAAYASVRASMIIGKFLDARDNVDIDSPLAGIPLFGKKDHAIDRRLAERRARLDAAKKKQQKND